MKQGKIKQILRTYDQNGTLLSQTDPLGRKTEYTVDVRGNVLEEKDPLGNIQSSTWSRVNRPLTETDPLGRVTTHQYYRTTQGDTTHVLTSTNPLGHKQTFSVDVCSGISCGNTGNLRAFRDGNGHGPGFSYDRRGFMRSQTEADEKQRTDYQHDSLGRVLEEKVVEVTGFQMATTLAVTKHTHDAKGNLLTTTDAVNASLI